MEKIGVKNTVQTAEKLANNRAKYFIHLLNVKSDTNMTRVYSALHQSDFFSSTHKNK